MLDIQGGDDVDPGLKQLLHVLPALGVATARNVCVRQLVHQRDLRMPGEHGIDIHLLERSAPVTHHPPGDDRQIPHLRRSVGPAVGLDKTDDHLSPATSAPAALLQHRVCLADTGGRTQVDAQGACRV